MSPSKHILVTGAGGQLASCLQDVMPGEFRADYLDLHALDITSESAIEEVFSANEYDVCINCAAYTAVDKAEEESALAYRVNTEGPGLLASACARRDTLMIHISTDYVYDNDLRRPLLETDPLQPRSVYARSKSDGEKRVAEGTNSFVTLRTSWVYSEYGHNFVKTMLRLADSRDQLGIVHDQVGAPTYARDLAKTIIGIISQYTPDLAGTYNFCNAGVTTWADFAREIFNRSEKAVQIDNITTEAFGAPAPRPPYSVLDCTKIKDVFRVEPRDWKSALDECLKRLSESKQVDN